MKKVFISYSHRDEPLLGELHQHLSTLKRQKLIQCWTDRSIDAGAHVHDEIDEHLESADIVLLLISPAFIASDYCYNKEMLRALEREKLGLTRVIPIILKHVDWNIPELRNLLVLPTDGKPIESKYWHNTHEAFENVSIALRRVILVSACIGTPDPDDTGNKSPAIKYNASTTHVNSLPEVTVTALLPSKPVSRFRRTLTKLRDLLTSQSALCATEEIEHMEVTTMGRPMAGRSSLTAAMYHTMNTPRAGFTLIASSDDDSSLKDIWKNLVTSQGDLRWPHATYSPSGYKFTFSYGLKPILNITWMDYRGSAIAERDSESYEQHQLQSRISDSSALILCVPSDSLLAHLQGTFHRGDFDRFHRLLSDILVRYGNARPPIVIAATKSDLSEGGHQPLVTAIQSAFSPLFVSTGGWKVMLCFPSLGKELRSHPQSGVIDPVDTDLPMLCSILCHLRARKDGYTPSSPLMQLLTQRLKNGAFLYEGGREIELCL